MAAAQLQALDGPAFQACLELCLEHLLASVCGAVALHNGLCDLLALDAEPAGFEIQLFCVQTRAIQQYFLRPSALYPATAAPASAATLATNCELSLGSLDVTSTQPALRSRA